MHKISEENKWNKSTREMIRDYIPLVVLVLMVLIGLILIITRWV